MLMFLVGLVAAVGGRALFKQAMLVKFRRDLVKLNSGDYQPLLKAYANDAVLHFNDGPHRWTGDHHGRAGIERFLQDFTAAGLRGEILDMWFGGPPWAMTILARFDDESTGPDGEQLYANRTVLVLSTRWGKVVEQWDFYEDTGRILDLDAKLRELGVAPAGQPVAV